MKNYTHKDLLYIGTIFVITGVIGISMGDKPFALISAGTFLIGMFTGKQTQ